MKRLSYSVFAAVFALIILICSGCSNVDENMEVQDTEAPAGPKSIFMGTYEQDGNADTAEPIEWIVLAEEDGKMLVISKYALDCQMFNSVYGECSWDICSIRTWLNNDFYSNVFKPNEQARIRQLNVQADLNLENPEVDNGMPTLDKVFLLSSTQINLYFPDESSRKCQATVYAENAGVMTDADGNCCWWLRTIGHGFRAACYVDARGSVSHDGRGVDYVLYGVRPAMWIVAE